MTVVRTRACSTSGGGTSTASENYRGRYDYSTDLFPEVGGTGDTKTDGGRPTPGDYYIGTDAASGTLLDENEAPLELSGRITLTYIGAANGDMQLGINWKINQG